jgi:hypothetical protein
MPPGACLGPLAPLSEARLEALLVWARTRYPRELYLFHKNNCTVEFKKLLACGDGNVRIFQCVNITQEIIESLLQYVRSLSSIPFM